MSGDALLVKLLAEVDLFGGLPQDALAACAARFTEVHYPKGNLIFGRGDPGDYLLLVAEGRVQLSLASEEGRELSVRQASAGALVGEIAALDGGTRSADATAATAVTAYMLRRVHLDGLIAATPTLQHNVIVSLCRRLRETTDQLEGIALHSVEVRLVRFLLVSLAGRTASPGKRVPLDLAVSQSELAQLLGASRPKVNVALGALEKLGAVKRTADRLFCDPDMLSRLAGNGDG